MAAYVLHVGIRSEGGRYVATVTCDPESGSGPLFGTAQPFETLSDAAAAMGALIAGLAGNMRARGHRIGRMGLLPEVGCAD